MVSEYKTKLQIAETELARAEAQVCYALCGVCAEAQVCYALCGVCVCT